MLWLEIHFLKIKKIIWVYHNYDQLSCNLNLNMREKQFINKLVYIIFNYKVLILIKYWHYRVFYQNRNFKQLKEKPGRWMTVDISLFLLLELDIFWDFLRE